MEPLKITRADIPTVPQPISQVGLIDRQGRYRLLGDAHDVRVKEDMQVVADRLVIHAEVELALPTGSRDAKRLYNALNTGQWLQIEVDQCVRDRRITYLGAAQVRAVIPNPVVTDIHLRYAPAPLPYTEAPDASTPSQRRRKKSRLAFA